MKSTVFRVMWLSILVVAGAEAQTAKNAGLVDTAISTTEYGDPKTQESLLRDLSPLGKLDRIKTPLMVQHGANDTNVPVVEAEQIVENLKRRGVPVEYILFPDEGHGFRKEKNRITSTVKMVEFFVAHLTN